MAYEYRQTAPYNEPIAECQGLKSTAQRIKASANMLFWHNVFLLLSFNYLPLVDTSQVKPEYTWVMQNLLAKAQELGGNVDKVYAVSAGERGLFVQEDIDEDQVILTLPESLILTGQKAMRSPLFLEYAYQSPLDFDGMEPCTALAVFLLIENALPGQREASAWSEYYASLPDFYHDFNVPHIFWDSPDNKPLSILLFPPVLSRELNMDIEQHRKHISKFSTQDGFFSQLAHDAGSSVKNIIKLFNWAASVVKTRCWKTNTPMLGHCALLPVMDSISHKDGGNVMALRVHGENQQVVLKSKASLAAASRLSLDYDPGQQKCAQTMLLDHGNLPLNDGASRPYCVDFNIDLQVPRKKMSGETRLRHINFLKKEFVKVEETEQKVHLKLHVELREEKRHSLSKFLAALRTAYADAQTVEAAAHRETEFSSYINSENERIALEKASHILHGILGQMKSSENEDVKELHHWRDVAGFPNIPKSKIAYAKRMGMALRVRIHRRRTLQGALRFIENWQRATVK